MGTNPTVSKVSIIASEKNWIEGEAVRQLEPTASWEGMTRVFGMPDLHPGRGSPIGAAFITKGWIYPSLVGSDIGCGIGLWQTGLVARKQRLDRLEAALERLEDERSGETGDWLERWKLEPTGHEKSLGTIGGSNHFLELQKIDTVFEEAVFADYGLDKAKLCVLAHSGSRGLGEEILRSHTSLRGATGLASVSDEARTYVERHDMAVRWAECNRARIAARAFDLLGSEGRLITDVCHNHVVPVSIDGQERWIHRKGATPFQDGLVVIPGSRGDLSYLVEATGDPSQCGHSLPHGAGRKWKRSDCRGRLEKRFSVDSLRRTSLGGRVICSDKELVYEEAPQAYKDISQVIEDMTSRGHLRVIATLRPVITFKKGSGEC